MNTLSVQHMDPHAMKTAEREKRSNLAFREDKRGK